MLTTLAIKNLAIIDAASLDLGPGLNVLTGETGAGKSIIIGALSLILGDRARTDVIRRGAKKAEVSAIFELEAAGNAARSLAALDLVDLADASGAAHKTVEVIVRRIVAPNGKGRVYINGQLTTVQTLARVMRGVVDVSSQHQHTQLLDPAQHLGILDRFGGLSPLRTDYDTAYRGLVDARRHRDAIVGEASERMQREDFVRFQLAEIEAVAPVEGEDETLETERQRLAHGDRLVGGAHEAEKLLLGGRDSVDGKLIKATRAAEIIADIDPTVASIAERLDTARIELVDIAQELASYANTIEIDPRRLNQVNDRLQALRRLSKKHGGDVASVLEAQQGLSEELTRFESLERATELAESALETARTAAWAAATSLSDARAQAATELTVAVVPELRDLSMVGADLRFELARRDTLSADGCDEGMIQIQTNIGEGFGPLHRMASGGELARTLLALKRVFMAVDPVETCVFDEVDSGTGGAVADVIGRKLAEIAGERQAIVITHLAQIAARGTTHLRVEKTPRDDRTVTTVRHLDARERTDEIARMLGGVEITPKIVAHARELLATKSRPS
ncbi:MAG: DNA repair protein RecN (Recombination protein N) [Myxococcota bacterium]|jgi:DNA repair protein RecN (Recombination protein N)